MIDKEYRLQVNKELSGILNDYKKTFILKGIKLPLNSVKYIKTGLLSELPSIDDKTGWPWNSETDATIYQKNQKWPKITVVIPSYNQGGFIEEAIRSILLQNYPCTELIVMDGHSTDNTIDVLKKYTPWISYWQSENDSGQGQAINLGFSIASGDYYGWLNSDDFYNEKAFFVLASEIIRSNKALYYGDAFLVNKDNSIRHYWKGYLVKDIFLRFGGLIASHSAFWKSLVHKPVWEAMNCNVDGELWIRLVKNQSKKHIKFPIGSVRFYDETKSAHAKWKDKWQEDDLNIDRIHRRPPGPRSFKAYFFRFVQHLYKKYAK